MKKTISAPTLVALLVAAACDPAGDELDRELEIAAEDEDADEDADAEDIEGPDALQSEVDPAEALTVRFTFQGACSDVSDRTGVGVLSIDRSRHVRGIVFDDWYPGTRIALSGSLDKGGSFEGIELAPFGECTWFGYVDTKTYEAEGGWDCGHGCAGEWSN